MVDEKDKDNIPKAGDGTQHEKRKGPSANWYGSSEKPQEEFIEDGVRSDNGIDPAVAPPLSDEKHMKR